MNDCLSIEPVVHSRDLLGECPLWDERGQRLYWIDSRAQRVRAWDSVDGTTLDWMMPTEIGSIALCESGRLLVALVDSFFFLDPVSGEIVPFVDIKHPASLMRLNDGRVDRAGRFCVGSMALGRHEEVGELYQLDGNGSVRTLDRGFSVSNSTCFSPDGKSMYFSDSLSHQIWRYSYDTASGAAGERTLFVDTTTMNSAPDGATVDADGYVWTALVLTGQIARFAPDGTLDRIIDVPTPYPSCPAIGGAQFDTIYVTSISNSGNVLRSDHACAGVLLAVRGTGVRGLIESRFADSPLR